MAENVKIWFNKHVRMVNLSTEITEKVIKHTNQIIFNLNRTLITSVQIKNRKIKGSLLLFTYIRKDNFFEKNT